MPHWEYAEVWRYFNSPEGFMDTGVMQFMDITYSNGQKEKLSNASIDDLLGRMGSEGWELVSDNEKSTGRSLRLKRQAM